MNKTAYWVSRLGHKKLNEKYEAALQEEIYIQKQIGDSVRMDNDLRENPDYMALQTKAMTEMKVKINKIKEVLFNCKIIEDSIEYKVSDNSEVYIGAHVKVEFSDSYVEEYRILGYDEADIDNNIISYLSPLGNSLLGKKIGETFEFINNDFKELIKIIGIQRGGDN